MDQNTTYFFKCIKSRRNRNAINGLFLKNGTFTTDKKQIKEELVSSFKNLLCSHCEEYFNRNFGDLIDFKVPRDVAQDMIKKVSSEEIRETLFSMESNKAPGPDRFGAHFFKRAWKVVGDNVIEAIKFFFSLSSLLHEVNCTIIALVPKSENPTMAKDFWLISCRNTIYKCITKIMANRLKNILPLFINKAQGAFVRGRKIGDNILLCSELLHNYHKNVNNLKKCAIKINVMKAYVMVN